MAKQRIKEVSRENHLTGEVVSHYSLYANKYTESFIMIRTTLGKEWFYALGNNEKNLLMMLWDWSSHEDMTVYLGSVRRNDVCRILNIGKRQLTSIISSLCSNDYIKRIGRDDFLVNPQFMFKCSVGKVREKIKLYNEYKF